MAAMWRRCEDDASFAQLNQLLSVLLLLLLLLLLLDLVSGRPVRPGVLRADDEGMPRRSPFPVTPSRRRVVGDRRTADSAVASAVRAGWPPTCSRLLGAGGGLACPTTSANGLPVLTGTVRDVAVEWPPEL
jgi:hypothetical protein